jgi:RNA polymerase sigma factor (TIGR02999 family)
MRQILVDHARRHATLKRGRKWQRVPFDENTLPAEEQAEALLALDDALTRLSTLNERLTRIVECRFFGGMTERETADALGLSERTVRRDWLKARVWLYGQLTDEDPDSLRDVG